MSVCRSCGQQILWCFTSSRKRMPVDIEPDPNGLVVPLTADGELREGDTVMVDSGPTLNDPPDLVRYTSHFATCPNADEWRKR